MTTLAQGEEAGKRLAGASSIADLRGKSADDLMKTARGGGGVIVDGWYVPEDLSITFAEGRQKRGGRAGRL